MNTAPEAPYSAYYREVELHWSWRREKQIIVSPIEFEAIERWFEAEIPLAVVLRAIDLFMQAKAKNKRKRNHLLTHVEATVQKVFAEYQMLHVAEDNDADLFASKRRKLINKLKRVVKDFPQAQSVIETVIEAFKKIDSQSVVSFEVIETDLEQLDKKMLNGLQELLDPSERQSIRQEAEELLEEAEDPQFFAKIIDDGIRFHFGVPRLTILG